MTDKNNLITDLTLHFNKWVRAEVTTKEVVENIINYFERLRPPPDDDLVEKIMEIGKYVGFNYGNIDLEYSDVFSREKDAKAEIRKLLKGQGRITERELDHLLAEFMKTNDFVEFVKQLKAFGFKVVKK